jgi:hypothetical protein
MFMASNERWCLFSFIIDKNQDLRFNRGISKPFLPSAIFPVIVYVLVARQVCKARVIRICSTVLDPVRCQNIEAEERSGPVVMELVGNVGLFVVFSEFPGKKKKHEILSWASKPKILRKKTLKPLVH